MNKIRWNLLLFIIFLGGAVWYMNQGTPMMQDDYLYATYMGAGNFSPGVPNKCMSDVLSSCVAHYVHTNGRMANNLAFFLFYVGDKSLYNVLATVVTLVSVLSLSRLFLGRWSVFSVSFTITCCVLLIPSLYHTTLWLAGSFNYLWGACCLLLSCCFLYYRKDLTLKRYVMLRRGGYLLLVLAASMHEMLGVTLLGALGCRIGIHIIRRKEIARHDIYAIVAVALGALLPLTSPGIYNRAAGGDYMSVKYLLLSIGMMVRYAWCTTLAFGGLFVYHTWKRQFDIWYMFAGVAFVLTILVGPHSVTGCSYFYYGVAVLMWLLKTIAPWVLQWKRGIRTLWVLVTIGLMLLCCRVTHIIDNQVEKAFAMSEKTPIVLLDVDSISETEAIAYVSALPINTSFIYPYLGKYHGIDDFIVIQRTRKGNGALYKKLASEAAEKVVSTQTKDGWTYIRLPKDRTCCIFYGVDVFGSTKTRVTICPYMHLLHKGIWVSLYDRFVAGQKFANGSLDYEEGYVFIIIPPIGDSMTHVQFKMQDLRSREESLITHVLK